MIYVTRLLFRSTAALLVLLALAAPADAVEGCGDMNDDGEITTVDALALLTAAVGQLRCRDYVCDLNGDGNFTASDSLAVLALDFMLTLVMYGDFQ